MISSASSANHHQQPNGTPPTPIHGAPHHHRHHHDKEEEEAEGDGGDEQEQEEEEEEVVEDAGDCFFESLDRVPSSVSFVHDLPTDSDDDEEDDVRVSFASAIAEPSDLQSVTCGRDERVVEHQEDRSDEVRSGYDYQVWMAEPDPTSINERRRRFLHGMGFSSNKDLTAAIRSRSRKAAETPAAAKKPPTYTVPLPPLPQPVVARCRSVVDLTMTQRPPKPPATPSLPRATSAPPTLCDQLERQNRGATSSPEPEGEEKSVDPVHPSGGILRIKNLDTGKEFLVSEVVNDGNWGLNDLETGTQISMDEFEQFLGYSPIVKELMRRASMGDSPEQGIKGKATPSLGSARRSKSGYRKKGSWFKNIKFVASTVTGRITEKDIKGDLVSKTIGKSSCDCSSEVMKVRQHGKSYKELTGLYMSQEIHAHKGSIWSIKFSWDGRYLASAGEDRVVHVWLVQESNIHSTSLRGQDARSLGNLRTDTSPEKFPLLASQLSRMSKKYKSRKRSVPDYIVMPEVIFSLSKKPICSFEGHLDDVLDLSWSKSQLLLSSSMDKTVRLWDMESKACLKLFAHNDYVTCIQFNPMDDSYFISGSLDAKVRIWSIPEHQVVDWSDLHEMVTAACYTPDGQGALVGSHKGNFRRYKTSACKLSQESQIEIRKKKAHHAKKITGFQFAPGSPSEVLITSADSRVRVFDGLKLVHKFRGFRNTSSQISASYTSDGKYVICASEDSHVYVWNREAAQVVSSGSKNKGWTTTRSHEYFHCKDVSVAIPWPTAGSNCSPLSLPPSSGMFNLQESLGHTDSQRSTTSLEDIFHSNRSHYPPLPKKSISEQSASKEFRNLSYSGPGIDSESFASSANSLRCGPVPSSLSESSALSSFSSWRWHNEGNFRPGSTDPSNAWGLVVVTAGLDGDIRIYQNFGLPLRLRQPF